VGAVLSHSTKKSHSSRGSKQYEISDRQARLDSEQHEENA